MWDDLPTELRVECLALRFVRRESAAVRIQRAWRCFSGCYVREVVSDLLRVSEIGDLEIINALNPHTAAVLRATTRVLQTTKNMRPTEYQFWKRFLDAVAYGLYADEFTVGITARAYTDTDDAWFDTLHALDLCVKV